MKNFKSMKDVFSLPVKPKNVEHWANHAPAKRYACHAINHVDALTENLSAMVGMFERLCEANDFDADRQPEYVAAKATLAAYRGEL